ncbi:peptidylprolyl isomerase [Sphingomonas profundi]|uniref:peptidylprolyl isomerase n=1 Tax=Alterirhizorhabdus profundi TaxID=2681549 RepID=UPI001E380DA2|nr:peptidylprolyl isomerase [Sphingomonas profundi]
MRPKYRAFFCGLLALIATAAPAAPPAGPRVRIETTMGPIVIALATKQAPITTQNFLRYADEKRFDGTTFYRAARGKRDPKAGLLQGGIDHHIPRALPPIAHEPTSRTGLSHVDGTVSMARNAPGTAMGDFFIIVGAGSTYLDARPGSPGYAAFGTVVSGMPLVRRILAMPTWPGGFSKETIGQSLRAPVRIVSVRRVP